MQNSSASGFVLIFLLLSFNMASAQISIIGELSNDRQVAPGEQYEGSITVVNESEESQEAKIYQTDYQFNADGTNNYGEPGTLPRSNAHWIRFSPSNLVLPPRGTAEIQYRVTVPAEGSQALSGSYWSMLMVEAIQRGSTESTLSGNPRKKEMGLHQSIRYGIQIASHIANTGTKNIRLIQAGMKTSEEGKTILQIDMENTGTIGMRPDVYVEVFNEAGMKLGRFPGLRYRIYPGTSVRQLIEFDSLSKGNHRALVVIDDGGNDVFAAEYTLEF
jgi:hypothetical protein